MALSLSVWAKKAKQKPLKNICVFCDLNDMTPSFD